MKGKKTGGRKKGTPNKSSLVALELADRLNVNPLEILFKFAAGDWKGLGYDNEVYFAEKADGQVRLGYVISPEMRLSAAKEATQYLFPKKKEQSQEEDQSIDVTSIEDKKKLLERAKEEIAKLEEEIKNET